MILRVLLWILVVVSGFRIVVMIVWWVLISLVLVFRVFLLLVLLLGVLLWILVIVSGF